MLRRWRGRFGIAAPLVAVRPHWPWYARLLAGVAVLLLIAWIIWMFYPAARLAAFSCADEVGALQSANATLEEEVARLRGMLAARENDLQIERVAQRSLSDKHKALMEENARLKEELAVLERLAAKTRKK